MPTRANGVKLVQGEVPVLSLEEDLVADLQQAIRSGETVRRDTIRQLRAALHNEAIALGRPLETSDALTVVRRLVNQHRDSIAEFGKAGRQDLVDREEAELQILTGYLPEEISREEIVAAARTAVEAVGASGRQDMGKVMRELTPQLRGRADMRMVSEVVQDLLG